MLHGMDLPRPVPCTNCGQRRAVPIVYGMPDQGLMDLAEKGVIALGGCVVPETIPTLRCQSCGHSWVDE